MSQAPAFALTRWSQDRIARLAFLVGQGLPADAIARDPVVAANVGNVHRQARRFGLAFREGGAQRLPSNVQARLDKAAARRGISHEKLIHLLLLAAGSDEGLIDNVLDDR